MQQVIESVRIALQALWANKLRSALTILCVIISIMSIIAVVSILDGMDFYVKEKVLEQGSNVFTVERVNQWEILTDFDKFLKSLKNPELTLEDMEAIDTEVREADFVDAALDRWERLSVGRRYVENVEIRGRTAEYPGIGDFPLVAGRHFGDIDVQQRRMVCVVGWEVAQNLFPEVDPLGRAVKFAGRHYTVIGVVEKKPSVLGSNPNVFAFIPVTTFLKHFGTHRWTTINIPVRTASMETFNGAQEKVRMVMRIRHKLKPNQEDDFYISTSETLVNLWATISGALFGSLIGIVSITLVVGGIIIMNVMLVAVNERTREIGTRKAVGAKRRDIASQFIVESLTLTFIGGIIGIVLGFFAAFLVAAFSPLPYRIAPWSIFAALVITFIVGLFFGVYPASRAARLDPVDALRYE
jgi:putative ABC transport system permease protein